MSVKFVAVSFKEMLLKMFSVAILSQSQCAKLLYLHEVSEYHNVQVYFGRLDDILDIT